MQKIYGLNWIEIARRLSLGIVSIAMLALFGWILTHIHVGLNWETVLVVGMVLVFLAAIAWSFQSVFGALWQNPHFQLHERGVTLVTNSDEIDWDWDEFRSWSGKLIYHKMYGVITLYIADGCEFLCEEKAPLMVTGLVDNAPKLAETIMKQIIKTQAPKLVDDFRQGKTLDFGTMTLNKQGLQQDNTFIPFEDIREISMNEAYFWVHLKSQLKTPTRLIIGNKVRAPQLLFAVMQTLLRPS